MSAIGYDDVLESECHQFTAEASELRWRPGYWPGMVETTIGNKMPFRRTALVTREGDVLYADYEQCNGCVRLRVFND